MSAGGSLKRFMNKHPRLMSAFSPVINRLPGVNKVRVKGKGNKIDTGSSLFLRTRISIAGNNNTISLGKDSILYRSSITICGNNNRIEIGDNVSCKVGDFSFEDDNGFIGIGSHTTISGHTHLACIEGRSIRIGKECLFSSDIIFRTGDSHSILDMDGARINPSRDVSVGDHVWISYNTTLTKGAAVPDNSIVGTGAIVTKKFEQPNVIIAGVPAEIIKENINWDKNRIQMRQPGKDTGGKC